MNNKSTGKPSLMTYIIIFAVIAIVLVSCVGNGGSHSPDTNKCKSCGRTFQAGDSAGNYMNIARTGMCNNCYNNYQWGKEYIGQ